jgi:ATP adenylyltransferase
MEYITGPRDEGCFLCAAAEGNDDLVLARREGALVILNKYPYNTGHLVVAPVRHVAELSDLTDEEHLAVDKLVVESVEVLRAEASPEGFNIGINLGEVAGAGLPGHLHVHIVPRWSGDTNFMPVIGETKVLPEQLADTYAKLKPRFETRP